MVVKGVWATPAAREELTPPERASCVENYEQYEPQLLVGVAHNVHGLALALATFRIVSEGML